MKKIITSAIKAFFEDEFDIVAKKVTYRKELNADQLQGIIYFGDDHRVNFDAKFSSVFNYSLSFIVRPNQYLYSTSSIQEYLVKDKFFQKLKNSTELNFKFKNYHTVGIQPDFSFERCVNGVDSTTLKKTTYHIMNAFGRELSQERNLYTNFLVKITEDKIIFKDDFTENFSRTRMGAKADYTSVGKQVWAYTDDNIDRIMTLIYHNFFYYVCYYNNAKSPFSSFDNDEIFQKDYRELHYTFMTEYAIKQMSEI